MSAPFTRGVFGRDQELIGWACDRIGYVKPERFSTGCNAIGVTDSEGNLKAAAIYSGYDGDFHDIEISFAMEPGFYLSKSAISMLLRYPFGQLKCQRVTAATPLRATSTRQFLEKLGFKREGVLRRRFGTDSAAVYGILAKEWARSKFNTDRRTDVPPLPVRNLIHGEKRRVDHCSGA
ncbi:GNAT family N-acetyltransferase [Caulobacter sp. UC70_42]|uniref:GNAT family N-acetyltransferase n=1 Tax=Caulobacter sp. UC70_42 TaxID=3374551 RepID=UPI0037563F44